MKAQVTKLCDPWVVEIPAHLLTAHVDSQQLEQQIGQLAVRYAQYLPVQTVAPGDVVFCHGDEAAYPDKRQILLYPSMGIPGAEQAEKESIGKTVGACFTTQLAGKEVSLCIKNVLHPIPAQVNDALIASMGLEGIDTVAAYWDHLAAKMLADQMMENRKMAMGHLITQMIAQSCFAYDEQQMERYLQENMERFRAESEQVGMEASEEEIRTGVLEQAKEGWLAQEFCRRKGIEIDREAAQADADQMMEMMRMMGEPVPEREQMVEEAMNNAYLMELFSQLDEILTQKMGGDAHGNH